MTRRTGKAARLLVAALALLAVPSGGAAAQSLWPGDGRGDLVTDTTAARRGDIVTILIRESQVFNQSESTELTQDTSLAAALKSFGIKPSTFSNLPDIEVESARSFEGEGMLSQTRSLEARISAMVIDVMANGNLVIEGRRTVQIDDEVKRLVIGGVVRRFDVTGANTVLSENVAHATIRIESEGPSKRARSRGFLGQCLDYLWHHVWPL